MNSSAGATAQALKMLKEVRELLQCAHFTSRALHAELELSHGDSLADRIHEVRMAAEELRHSLESRLGAKAL